MGQDARAFDLASSALAGLLVPKWLTSETHYSVFLTVCHHFSDSIEVTQLAVNADLKSHAGRISQDSGHMISIQHLLQLCACQLRQNLGVYFWMIYQRGRKEKATYQ